MSEETNEEAPVGASNTGNLKGVPGPVVKNVGVLDLRGSSVEDLKRLERIENVGTLLIDPEHTGALSNAVMVNVGSMVEAGPDEKIMMGPLFDFDRTAVESMPDGQSVILIGIVAFADDVDGALVSQKFERIRLTGILIAPSSVRGALIGKLEHTGPSIASVSTPGGKVHVIGHQVVTPGYLKYLKDGVGFINIGHTEFAPDVPVDLVEQKIAAYFNVGATVASQDVLDYLQARAAVNLGAFSLPKAEGEE